jgi:hypothetical protein
LLIKGILYMIPIKNDTKQLISLTSVDELSSIKPVAKETFSVFFFFL